jgi:hypothetical protein
VYGQWNKRHEQAQRKGSRDVVPMEAPIFRIVQEILEGPHRPMSFDAVALASEALEEASCHGMMACWRRIAVGKPGIIQIPHGRG